jgi:hypothetical protein
MLTTFSGNMPNIKRFRKHVPRLRLGNMLPPAFNIRHVPSNVVNIYIIFFVNKLNLQNLISQTKISVRPKVIVTEAEASVSDLRSKPKAVNHLL